MHDKTESNIWNRRRTLRNMTRIDQEFYIVHRPVSKPPPSLLHFPPQHIPTIPLLTMTHPLNACGTDQSPVRLSRGPGYQHTKKEKPTRLVPCPLRRGCGFENGRQWCWLWRLYLSIRDSTMSFLWVSKLSWAEQSGQAVVGESTGCGPGRSSTEGWRMGLRLVLW